MTLKTAIDAAFSLKTTVVLLGLLALLLFLGVALPQERTIGEDRFQEIVDGSPSARFVLLTLGLGRMSVSPVFLTFLALFFVHLAGVLVGRTRVTLRRTQLRPPSTETLNSWVGGDRALRGNPVPDFDRRKVLDVLKGFGYRAVPVGESAMWSVKHRSAPIGFLLFHISFFLILLGGILIYYTRSVATVRMVEGHSFAGFTSVIRRAPAGGPPTMRFTVQQIDAVFEGGEPVHLSASLRFQDRAGAAIKRSEVNHPARWGSSTLLVTQAGLAPKIWLQDLQGFTLDRVAVAAATLSGRTTAVPLASGALIAELRPVVDRADFPDREGLRVTELEVTLRRDEQVLFEGRLLPGQHAVFDDAVLVLEDIGYWVGLYVVSERGGSFLVAGFILGTIGLVWRLMLYRRELAVVWDEQGFGVAGRAEYFSDRFKTELATVKQFLER